jgi:hypothetical protein
MSRTNQHAAQTDAVLHTLGYPRSKPTASAGRWKRSAELVAAVVLSILAAWGAVVWLT